MQGAVHLLGHGRPRLLPAGDAHHRHRLRAVRPRRDDRGRIHRVHLLQLAADLAGAPAGPRHRGHVQGGRVHRPHQLHHVLRRGARRAQPRRARHARRHRVRPRDLRLRRGRQGARRRVLHHPRGKDLCHTRLHVVWQEHADVPAQPPLRHPGGLRPHHHRRRGRARHPRRLSARQHRHVPAGALPVQPHHRPEHRHHQDQHAHGGDPPRGVHRLRGRGHHGLYQGL